MKVYEVDTPHGPEWCRTLHEAKIAHLSLKELQQVAIRAYKWDGKATPSNEHLLHVYALIMGRYVKKIIKNAQGKEDGNRAKNINRINTLQMKG